jgi:hypothetical protein
MNDNRSKRPRPPRLVAILGGIEQKPEPCICGSENAFADREPVSGDFYVSCADCGAEGPRVATYDLAVAQWNSFVNSILPLIL